MASFECIGFINIVKYLPDSVLVFVDEFKKGYKKSNGQVVDDKYLSWRIIYKPYFKKYISEHFSNGMLVKIKGEVLPYTIEEDKMVNGYSVIGETINIYSYPRYNVKNEIRMIKDSQSENDDEPNIEDFKKPDF